MTENTILDGAEVAIHSQSEVRGSNLCFHLREVGDLKLSSSAQNVNLNNAVIVKDIIRMFITGECDISEVDELVDEGIGDEYETSLTAKKRKEALARTLKRYLTSEKRMLSVPETKIINVNGSLFRVRPDAIYDDGKTLEGIVYRNCLPNVTQTGSKRDGSVEKCTELYLINEYLKTLVPYGESRQLKASYYFLRKPGDTKQFDPNFFGEGRNVVSLEDTYVNDSSGVETDNDKKLKEQIDEFEVGRECSGEDCENCILNNVCNYMGSPLHQEKKVGKKAAVTLTEAQQLVRDAKKGAIRVVAGAGAGKTECVVQRVVKLVTDAVAGGKSLRDACRAILMITFTEAGCKEMKARVRTRLEEHNLFIDAEDLAVKTFNQFAYEIVKRHYKDLGFTKEPAVIDDVRNSVIITQLLEKTVIGSLDYLHFSQCDKNTKGALACTAATFDILKNLRCDPLSTDTPSMVERELANKGFVLAFVPSMAISQLCMLFDDYSKRLIEDNLVVFADQEPMMLTVFEKHPDLVKELGYKHIIVDEFQDSNDVQMQTIQKLYEEADSLMVVGDDSQSIFGFRNTTPENILHFFDKMHIKDGIDLRLVDNYRSTPEILDLANKINGLNKNRIDKDLVSKRESSGRKPVIKGFHEKKDELDFIVSEIKRLIDEEHYVPEDIAFISFTNAELVKMGAALSEAGIPWVMMNPTVLMSNCKVIAALSLAEAFWTPDATRLYFDYLTALYDGNILMLPHKEINDQIKELQDKLMGMDQLAVPAQRQIFHDMLEALKAPKHVEKTEDGQIIISDSESSEDEIYDYFLELLYQCEDFPTELQYVADFRRYGTKVAKRMEQAYQGVVLTTAHSSKGLEWKVVFNSLTSYDNPFLHGRHDVELEERRRLLFVSLTRARDLLYVTGQYVAYSEVKDKSKAKDGDNKVYNQFLREAFEQNGDAYDPVDPMAEIKKAERKKKAAESARKRREKTKDAWAGFTKNLPGQTSFV